MFPIAQLKRLIGTYGSLRSEGTGTEGYYCYEADNYFFHLCFNFLKDGGMKGGQSLQKMI